MSLAKLVFRLILGMSAEFWWRCELFFQRFPFLLIRLVDPLASGEAKQAVLDALFSLDPSVMLPECCLDPHFTRKAHSKTD
jgi:hypothetical protein